MAATASFPARLSARPGLRLAAIRMSARRSIAPQRGSALRARTLDFAPAPQLQLQLQEVSSQLLYVVCYIIVCLWSITEPSQTLESQGKLTGKPGLCEWQG
jgi:hypothetical protein